MRIVRWAPSERVDVPDLTAMSFLVLGEFRRTVRALVSGDAAYVVQGFKVEPESPATTRIRVRLQPPGEFKGAAIGGEQTTPGLDYGQLIGNRDSSFINEGASEQFIDFTGQPNGSYVVELRFTYTDGVSDNRAFWNSGTSSEYVAVTNTRHVSGWQIQRVAVASGGQWIPLATVAWDGVAVDAVDITDTRVLLFEGSAPFTRATQDGAGAVEDFDRSTSRANDAVGRFRVREVVRALQRQVQDLKGASDAGTWDWFSRVYRPFDPGSALAAQKTKNLRSVDTVTYTIGDGVTTVGDFNGASGLSDCLTLLAGVAVGSRPERVEIVLHGGVTYTIATSILIATGSGQPLTLTIRAGHTLAQGNTGLFGRPQILVTGAGITASSYALALASTGGGAGNLILRDLDVQWSGTTASFRGLFAATGYMDIDRCNIQMPVGVDVAAGEALWCSDARRFVIRNSSVRGRCTIFNDDDSGARPIEELGGLISHCKFEETSVRLYANTPSGLGIDCVHGFTIEDSYFAGRPTAIFTGSRALIDAKAAQRLRIRNCNFAYGIEEQCILGDEYSGSTLLPFGWSIENCTFSGGVANGTHAVGAGSGGADGTGWAVRMSKASAFSMVNCRIAVSSIDAGGIRLSECSQFRVGSIDFVSCGHTAGGSDNFTGIWAGGTAGCGVGKIEGVRFSNWLATQTRVLPLNMDFVYRMEITGCELIGREVSVSGTAITPAANYCALRFGAGGQDVRVRGCLFEAWARDTANARTILLNGSHVGLLIGHCQFRDCGGYVLDFVSGTISEVMIDSNQVSVDSTLTQGEGFDLRSLSNVCVTNNSFTGLGPATPTAVWIDSNDYLVMGNRAAGWDIKRTGPVTGRGYNEVGQNLNLVNAYS